MNRGCHRKATNEQAIAKAFAAASAPHVILVGRRLEKLDQVKEHISREFTSCKVHCFSADVSNASSVEKMFDEILANGLQVDVLINNAGINDARTPIADSNPDNWWRNYVRPCHSISITWIGPYANEHQEVMVKGPFVCTRAFFRQRKSITTSGAVIMVSSVGSYATLPNASSYGSAKAALNRFTEWVGVEGKDHNIHAVAFHPGGVAGTELTSSSPEHLQRLFTENGYGSSLIASVHKRFLGQ
ncbi:hypothetical protein PRZ48_000101 [Zasmidium cellare]|uniref:Uncharacterized protein n=1 Tax=Zasmidium cellare TaxID=395010 RepID=A0ABR0EXJ2_ZASCE|nr:hypothetical protein PRZ48_000101 [Zasmidium cellare]